VVDRPDLCNGGDINRRCVGSPDLAPSSATVDAHGRAAARAVAPMSGCRIGDACVVTVDEFERLRAEICASGPASSGDNLLGMEIDACAYLGDPAYAAGDPSPWRDMSVQRLAGADWLITGRASGNGNDAPSIAAELSRIWDEKLRYNFRSVHTVISAPDSVTLLAVTQIAPGGIWVTANVRVALM
jgi:hypothetical protein